MALHRLKLKKLDFYESIHTDDRNYIRDNITADFNNTIPVKKVYRYRQKHKAGHYIWIESQISIKKDSYDKKYLFLTAKDITQTKVHEEKIVKNKIDYFTLVNTIPYGVVEIDLDGNYTFVNQANANLIGYSIEEMLQMNIADVQVAPDNTALPEKLHSLAEKELTPTTIYGQIKKKNGKIVDVKVDWQYKRDKNNKVIGFVNIVTDITEQEKKKEELFHSENRYQAMFENIDSGVAIYKPCTDDEDFRFVAFNSAAEKITHAKRENIIGKTLLECFPNMDKSPFFSALKKVRDTGEALHIEPFFYKDDIREGWRENYIYQLYSGEIVAIFTDVTKEKISEMKLQESNTLLETTLNAIPDVIAVLDNDFNAIKYNDTGYKLIGKSPEDAIG